MFAKTKNCIRVIRNICSKNLADFTSRALDINMKDILDSLEYINLYQYLDYEDSIVVVGGKDTISLISYKNNEIKVEDTLKIKPISISGIYTAESITCSLKTGIQGKSYICLSLYN